MNEEPRLHIASAVVRFQAAMAEMIREELGNLPSLHLVAFDETGKAAIVIEAGHRRGMGEILNTLPRLPGVLDVVLVAYVTECRSALREEIV